MTTPELMAKSDICCQELRDLARRIETHCRDLEAARPAVAEIADQVKRAKNALTDREIRITAEVASELTDDLVVAKLKYASVDARKTETNKRVIDDPEAQQLQARLSTLDTEKFNAELAVKSHEDAIKALDYVRALKIAEADMLVAMLRAQTMPSAEVLMADVLRAVKAHLAEHAHA